MGLMCWFISDETIELVQIMMFGFDFGCESALYISYE